MFQQAGSLRRSRSLCRAVLSIAALLGVACGDSSGPAEDVTLEDLAGTWGATRLEWSAQGGSGQRFDFIQNGGSLQIATGASGTVTGSGASPLTGPFTISGTIAVSRDTLNVNLMIVAENPDAPAIEFPARFTFMLAGNDWTLTSTEAAFDFDFNGTLEPATLIVGLRRAG